MGKFISDAEMAKVDPSSRAPSSRKFISDDDMIALEGSPPVDPKTSPVTAFTTGAIQGAVPFASAIGGIGKTAMDAVTGTRGPLAGSDFGDLVDDYRNTRDSFSHDVRTAADAHPKTAFAGNLAGGFTNPLFNGANTLPKMAGAGAIQGLGLSDADLTKGEVKGAGIHTVLGALGGALGYGAGKAVPKLWDGTKYLAKKGLTTLGPSEEAINARLAGRAQPDALSYPELAENMSGSVKNLRDQISEKAKDASDALSTNPALPKQYVIAPIDDAIRAQGKLIGSTDKQVADVLGGLKKDLAQYGDMISEKEIKTLIQKMDDNINWDDQGQNKLNQVIEGLRHKFDQTLKFQNSSYKSAMIPVSERVAVMDNIRRQFNLRNVPGQGLQPTDTTASKIQTALRENKAVTQESLEKLKDFTGADYSDLAKNYQLSQQFENTAPNGARRTVLGGAVGGLLGHGSPGAIGVGAATGATLDKYGGQAAGKMIDAYLAAGNSAAFGKFEPVIKAAVEKGPEALAVTGSILSTNPEFRKLMNLDKKAEPTESPSATRKLGSVGGKHE